MSECDSTLYASGIHAVALAFLAPGGIAAESLTSRVRSSTSSGRGSCIGSGGGVAKTSMPSGFVTRVAALASIDGSQTGCTSSSL